MNSELISVTGHWEDDAATQYDVLVHKGCWDGNENDHHIFYYADGVSLRAGDVIAENFVIDNVQEA